MKSTVTQVERRQRMEWIIARRYEIRNGGFSPSALLELRDLSHELTWWAKR